MWQPRPGPASHHHTTGDRETNTAHNNNNNKNNHDNSLHGIPSGQTEPEEEGQEVWRECEVMW